MMRIKKIRMAIVLIVALAVVLVSISGALADSVLKSPGDDTGNWFWYPERAYSDNGLFAKGKTGQVQQYFDYGFAIPAGATIDGIAVRLEARRCALASSGSIAVELSSDGGTSWTSTGYVAGALTLSEVTYTLGGATNNWGRTWTSAEINDNLNFKVRVTATASGRTPCVCLDWIPVRVYYNVAPTVDAGPDQTVDEGDTVSFSGSFTDPGADTHTIVWDFGDGSTAAGTLTPSHAYGDNGVYTVTLTVTDDDGGVGTDTLTVTVNNVAPTVNAGPDQTVHVDSDVSFSGSFTDPGVDDTHTKEWDFGDGGTATGTLTPIHVYDNVGVYTVTLTVTDDDGGVGKDTTTITVTIPDLVVSKSVEIDDCKFIVTYTVTNIGDVSAGASTTCKLVNGAILETQPCPALDPGESYSDTFNPEPCSCGETLKVTVCADNNNEVEESDETNNCEVNFVECPPCLPDLVITNIWTVGNKIHYTIQNKGCMPAPRSLTGVYIDDIYRASEMDDPLAPGEKSDEVFGRYNYRGGDIRVCADYSDTIEEIDETNNCRGWSPAEKPDLVIEDKWAEWGSATHYIVTYTIHNKGTAVAPACHNTTLYVDGVAIEHKHVPVDLAYCETYTDTFDTFIECTGDSDTIRVCADNYNVIDELDETNNCLENEWICKEEEEKPDLVIEDKWEEWESATHYIVTYTIHNKGTAVAPACHNTTLYVDGVAIEHKHVPVDLAYCETYTDTFDTVIECTGDNDTIKVCADNYEVIDELDETNNCLENEWICKEGKPDLVITKCEPLGNEIHYTIKNIGGEAAPRSLTGLYIDNIWKATKMDDLLAPGEESNGVFGRYIYSGGEIEVCADYQDKIEEADEGNNCNWADDD